MQYGFNTENIEYAKAALLLYALYRSREKSSSLNGLETWKRFPDYIHAACLKSDTIPKFIDNFKKKADVRCINPRYLNTGLILMNDGTIAESDNLKDFKLDIIFDNSLLKTIDENKEALIFLVRERIEREKMEAEDEYKD